MTKRRQKKHKGRHSSIGQHKVVGKKLIPPLKALPKQAYSSWRDDHAPEMLWALLLAAAIPRDDYLDCFRTLMNWVHANFHSESSGLASTADSDGVLGPVCELDMTGLAGLSDEHFDQVAEILLRHPLSYGSLRPLLLVDCLPGRDKWKRVIGNEPTEHDWDTLAKAILPALDHQSEVSTDIRWLKLMAVVAAGRLHMPSELMHNFVHYPNAGDLRAVRPTIRSAEITMRRHPAPWLEEFWCELLRKTPCIDGSTDEDYFELGGASLPLAAILEARRAVIDRFHAIKSSTRVDARFDATFGFCLNAVSILEEIAAPPIAQLISGRLGLRALAETVITFAYLMKSDTPTVWTTYRSYGSGQAKLALLKLEELSGEMPEFVDAGMLQDLANEDFWQEYVDIDLGHWAGKNLRELAISGGTKDVYDTYYSWTSTFTHGQWCAIRDSNFMTCHNPLHRLHRIPRPHQRLLPAVVRDAAMLANRTLDLLEQAYPSMAKVPRFIEAEHTPRREVSPDNVEGVVPQEDVSRS